MNPSTGHFLSITLEIWRFWNMVENDDSIVAAECVVFLRKYSNYEKDANSKNPSSQQKLSITLEIWRIVKIDPRQQKRGTPKRLIKPCFWRKIDVDAPRRKRGTPRMRIKHVVFEWFWWSQGSKSDGALSHFESRWDYSNILRPQRWGTKLAHYVLVSFAAATARFWKVPNRQSQRHRSLAEDYDVLAARPNVLPSMS